MDIYYIGGSPGSGKSSIAKQLSKQFGFAYYKLDDYLFRYIKKAAKEEKKHCAANCSFTAEQTWMRTPQIQAAEEIGIYEEIYPYALAELQKTARTKTVVAEGAGFMPKIMAQHNILLTRYICIVPDEKFQRKAFAKRVFPKLFLIGCKDKNAAYENWMKRDILFAKEMLQQAKLHGYSSILVNGEKSLAENYATVLSKFNLTS